MSFNIPFLVPEPRDEQWCGRGPTLVSRLFEIGFFLRRMRAQMRIGDLSRAPLQLVRFELNGDVAECDWIARSQDPWDTGLLPEIGQRHASVQALKDAVEVRRLIFTLMPDVDEAHLRVYRELPGSGRELIITGQIQRYAGVHRRVSSIAMRAKLLGLCFVMENGILLGTVVDKPRGSAA